MAPDLTWNRGSLLGSSAGNMVVFTTTAVHQNGRTLKTTDYTFENNAKPGWR